MTRSLMVVGAAVLATSSTLFAAPPASYFKPGVPDFDQRHGALPNNGNFHCSPTSMADSLTWFDNNGYDVVPTARNGTQTPGGEVALINQLGMLANTNGGTWNDDAVRALRTYLSGPANMSGHRWDVKFQGTSYFRGYTVGRNAATVSGDWFRQELADGEDVMFSIDWYTETAPGVLSPSQGAHQIVLDGYTAGGDLLIRDPWYAEGIIERDTSFPGRLIYEYSTGTANLRAEIVAAISVSPKEHLFFDGIFHPSEYLLPITPTPQYAGGRSVYGDYVSLAIQDLQQATPFTGKTLSFVDPISSDSFFDVFFELDGTASITNSSNPLPPEWLDASDLLDVEVAFDPDTSSYSYELFINREAFGQLLGDTPVDVLLDSSMVTSLMLGEQAYAPLIPTQGGVPDMIDPEFQYPMETTDPLVIQLENEMRLAAIPEPTTLVGLAGLAMLMIRRRT